MARKRKTITVADLRTKANALLATTATDPQWRAGVASLLENVLHETGNYEGYNFLGWSKEGGCEAWAAAGKPEDRRPFIGDETRRVYYGAQEVPALPKGMAAAPGHHYPKAL